MLAFLVFSVLFGSVASENKGSENIRLVDGTDHCMGRVEVFYNNQWGTVCDDAWTVIDAEVVCNELDCGTAISAPGSAFFGQGNGTIWLDDVACTGDEMSLLQCPSKEHGVNNCGHHEDAGVICAGTGRVRLVNGMDACSGRVEVLHSYRWGTVCDDGWITADAQVVCREVGCGAPLFTPGSAYFGPGTGPIWMDDTTCTGDEPSLITCQSKGFGVHNCNHSEDAGVICSVQSRNIEVGTDGHTAYTSSGPHEHGHITFLKVWSNSTCITGIQIKYGKRWSPVYGMSYGLVQGFQLYMDEAVIQVYGRYSSYIHQLVFNTNMGRTFIVGSATGSLFNFYPVYHGAELRYITGTYGFNGITSFGVQWDRVAYTAPINREKNDNLSSKLKSENETN